VNVVDQGRHEDLIDGLFLDAGSFGRSWRGERCRIGRFLAQLFGGGEAADFGGWRESGFRQLWFARAAAGAGAEIIELAVENKNVAHLRNEDGLTGELLLEADGAAIGADAHSTGGVESNEDVLWAAADGEGLSLELRRVDGQGGLALDVRMDCAAIESHGEGATGFQDGKMRRAADSDLTALDEVDAGGAGFDVHVAAAAENSFYLPVDGFDAHGAGNGDGLAVDDADIVCGGFIGVRGGREERGAK